MKIRFLHLTLILGLVFSWNSLVRAQQESAIARKRSLTLELQKRAAGEQLENKVTWSISPYLRDVHFTVQAKFFLKESKRELPPPDEVMPDDTDLVDLGKLGSVAPPIREEYLQIDNLAKNIAYIRLSIIFYDYVNPETMKLVTTVAKRMVDFVPSWRLKFEVVNPPKPSLPQRVVDYKLQALVFLLTALLLALGTKLVIMFFRFMNRLETKALAVVGEAAFPAQNKAEAATAHAKSQNMPQAHDDGPADPEAHIHQFTQEQQDKEWIDIQTVEVKRSSSDNQDTASEVVAEDADEIEVAYKDPYQESYEEPVTPPVDIFTGTPINDVDEGPRMLAVAVNPEVRAIMESLTADECVVCACKDPSLGAFLMNHLSQEKLAEVIQLLPHEIASQVTHASFFQKADDVIVNSEKLRKLHELRNKNKRSRSPAIEKAISLIPKVGPEKEIAIFAALAEAKQYEDLKDAADRYFPAELIFNLPDKVLRSALMSMNTHQRVLLIASLSGNAQKRLLASLGRKGTKLRQFHDSEISQVQAEKMDRDEREQMAASMWKDFVHMVRELVRSKKEVARLVQPLINDWLHQKTQGRVGRQNGRRAA